MAVNLRRTVRHIVALLLLMLCVGSFAQTPPPPSIRGFVVGAEYTVFQSSTLFPSVPMGQNTPWWFGYRPDIPQAPTTHAEVPVIYGPTGVSNSNNWPLPTQHITYNPPGGMLPSVDFFNHATPYTDNFGYYPGVSALSIITSATIGADVINVNANHWGGFYGVLRGSNGIMTAQGLPWSSSGSDYGYFNAGDPNYQAYAPGHAAVNFYIYDINGSTPTLDSNGHLVYDLTNAPDNVSTTTNKARGRLTLRRKDYGARWEYGINPNLQQYANTFLIQGVWQIQAVEGSFTKVFSPADIGTTVGTYGQPKEFFPGLNYNDFNFYNVLPNGIHEQKSLVYQFLTAALSLTRSYNICTNQVSDTVTNTGDAALSNIIVTDTMASSAAPFNLAVGASNTVTQTATTAYTGNSSATAISTRINIERSLDLFNLTGTLADTTLNVSSAGAIVSNAPDNPVITVNAANTTTQLIGCLQICGYVCSKASLSDTAQTPVGNVTLTLTGNDLNGVAITPLIVTTDSTGLYCFMNVAPGTYTITETVPSAYQTLGSVAGDAGAIVSATVITVGATQVGVGAYNNEDFLLTQRGSLSGIAYCDTNKNSVYDSGEPLLSGVTITLTKPDATTTTTTTDNNGHYSFTGLPAGSYTVSAPSSLASGKVLDTSGTLTVTVVANQDAPNNNFGYISSNTGGHFTTYTQGGWGAAPHGNNPGAILAANFGKVFGSAGVTIGGNYTDTFTSASAVQAFLPQGGTPASLTFSAVNPTVKNNVFAGQVLALTLNVSFSNAGIFRSGLSSLHVASGAMKGATVAQVLTLANQVLGGATSGLAAYNLTLSGLNDICNNINQNYDNGTTDNHYLN